jgi:hypothetical protein
MKFKSIIGSVLLVAASVLFISVAPAQAGECSAEDPCHTYAMVDGSGVVTNIIVCQPSVCGSGTFAGSRVVPQVAANPETHQNQGGYLSNPGSTPVVESNGRFTLTNDNPTVTANVTENETSRTVLSTSLEPGVQSSFTFNDTVGQTDGRPVMRTETMDNSIGATLSYSKTRNSESSTATSGESITFDERQTEEYVELELMIQELTKLLANWSWFRSSLFGWFL